MATAAHRALLAGWALLLPVLLASRVAADAANEAKCRSGERADVDPCMIAGYALQHTAPARAAELHRLGCERGGDASCWGLHNMGWEFIRKGDVARGVPLIKLACDLKHAGSCAALGFQYDQDGSLPRDFKRAATYYGLACDLREPESCRRLARLHEKGRGVRNDPAEVERLMARFVEGRRARAESNYVTLDAFVATYRHELPNIEAACRRGEGDQCDKAAQAYERSDPALAVALYTAGCKAPKPICHLTGAYRFHAAGDYARAIALATVGCETPTDMAKLHCAAWADILRDADAAGHAEAVVVADDRACDLGYAASCKRLADAFEMGAGVRKDAKRASALRVKFDRALAAQNEAQDAAVQQLKKIAEDNEKTAPLDAEEKRLSEERQAQIQRHGVAREARQKRVEYARKGQYVPGPSSDAALETAREERRSRIRAMVREMGGTGAR
jgi:TPR repeat protein